MNLPKKARKDILTRVTLDRLMNDIGKDGAARKCCRCECDLPDTSSKAERFVCGRCYSPKFIKILRDFDDMNSKEIIRHLSSDDDLMIGPRWRN